MNTQILTTNDADIQMAASILRRGGLVAIPTETVYGLAAKRLLRRSHPQDIYGKGRPQDNPLILHIAKTADAAGLCTHIPIGQLRSWKGFGRAPLPFI
jgi:L-threonylcarbamoyladenylate synthase